MAAPATVVDTGGYAEAQHSCIHVLTSMTMPNSLDDFPNLSESTECHIDNCNHSECWVCCKCHKILCGRYGSKHMVLHYKNDANHCIAMGTGDLSFWCYKCDNYLDHLHIKQVLDLYKVAHIAKFKHPIHNLAQLMKQTDFTEQRKLEQKFKNDNKPVVLKFMSGTQLLTRKTPKKGDVIEYDSDGEQKEKNKNISHVHTGKIIKIDDNKKSIIVKDNTGSYCSYQLNQIKIKLSPKTNDNKRTPNSIQKSSMKANSNKNTSSGYGSRYNKYRGYDDNDDYVPNNEFILGKSLLYKKSISLLQGDQIEYKEIGANGNKMGIQKGKLISIDRDNMKIILKTKIGSVEYSLYNIKISYPASFWKCSICEFMNGIKTKECMVCSMNGVIITDKSKRPPKKSDNNNDNDAVMPDKTDNTNANDPNALPERFFVYGTLRDDDDSGAVWTPKFVNGCTASNGKLYGFKMYQRHTLNYPFAIQTNNPNDFIVGRILTFPTDKFQKKLTSADRIEGYKPDDDQCLFHRIVVNVENTDNNNTILKAVFYYQDPPKDIDKTCKAIKSGDWLKRYQN